MNLFSSLKTTAGKPFIGRSSRRKIRRKSWRTNLIVLMTALSWRSSVSRAFMASVAATSSSSRRSHCWENSSPHYAHHRQSKYALGFQRRSWSDDSEGNERRTSRSSYRESDTWTDELNQSTAAQALSTSARSVRKMRATISRIFSALGFLTSSTTSLFNDHHQVERLKPTVEAFQSFLTSSGIHLELSEAMNRRLLDNILILGRVQKSMLAGKDMRDSVKPATQLQNIPLQEDWLCYMRFATAAYGEAVIRAAEMDATGKLDTRIIRGPLLKTKMSEHVGIPEDDMAVLDVDYDGDSMHLRYFVAVDHSRKKVVLAIRGTFSLSEIICDVAAFTRPFCGGEAHSEMATVTERTWAVVGPTIVHLLEDNPGYEVVFVGHSLGAGCAALLNIMCHQNNNELILGRPLHCFAYACPPVFTPLDCALKATEDCTSFIHEKDVVPFLSVDSVRHVFASIRAIDELGLGWRERMKLVTGYKEPDERLVGAVDQANRMRLKPKDGAPVLSVPAKTTIWLHENEETGNFDAKVCDAEKISYTPFQIDANMIQDHFASRYEHALHHLE